MADFAREEQEREDVNEDFIRDVLVVQRSSVPLKLVQTVPQH